MKILSEMSTGMGSKYILAEFENDFYGYGTELDFNYKWGLPVNQCGTKESVKNHCKSIAELCKKNIKKYQKELSKKTANSDGWKLMIEHEQKKLEMLIEFIRVLSK
ncbi:MAG: hypothetical protein ACLRVD_08375 [Blautia caecimuris]